MASDEEVEAEAERMLGLVKDAMREVMQDRDVSFADKLETLGNFFIAAAKAFRKAKRKRNGKG